MPRKRCLGCRRLIEQGSRCDQCKAEQKGVYHTSEYQRNRPIVLIRDGYVCQLKRPGCEGHATTADHVIPASKGGKSSVANMVAACPHCNSGKRDRVR